VQILILLSCFSPPYLDPISCFTTAAGITINLLMIFKKSHLKFSCSFYEKDGQGDTGTEVISWWEIRIQVCLIDILKFSLPLKFSLSYWDLSQVEAKIRESSVKILISPFATTFMKNKENVRERASSAILCENSYYKLIKSVEKMYRYIFVNSFAKTKFSWQMDIRYPLCLLFFNFSKNAKKGLLFSPILIYLVKKTLLTVPIEQ
jgi:hypothetical protein